MSLFASLDVYHDLSSRSAAMHMAIDEALLETAALPSIRFYRWASPALSFGYFGRFADVAAYAGERDLVRRWTGGGIVFHGDDLTYSIVIPANDPLFREPAVSIYEKVHRVLCDALQNGERVELAQGRDPARRRPRATQRAVPTSECFSNPVPADVMLNGRKIAGAAQRRTGRGLLQQGSIQHVNVGNQLPQCFAAALGGKCETREIGRSIAQRAHEIAAQKYATDGWLRKR
jgi:lipoyl(octanoyl) transferase